MKLNPDYIVGFVDGEGTLNVVRYPDGRIRPQFLVFNTDKRVLELIKNTLDLKAPIFAVTGVDDNIKRKKTCYRLQVRSKEDTKKVRTFFKKHKPIVKKLDFEVFENAFSSWCPS